MSSFKVFSVSFIIALGLSVCLATIPGLRLPQAPAMPSLPDLGQQYTVNVHFIPAIHRADCSIGGTWEPPSLECARCFCFAPALSRCFPKSGCNPTTEAPMTSSTAASQQSSTIKPELNPPIANLEPSTTKPEAAPVPQEQVSVTPVTSVATSTTEASAPPPQEENPPPQPIRSVKP